MKSIFSTVLGISVVYIIFLIVKHFIGFENTALLAIAMTYIYTARSK